MILSFSTKKYVSTVSPEKILYLFLGPPLFWKQQISTFSLISIYLVSEHVKC